MIKRWLWTGAMLVERTLGLSRENQAREIFASDWYVASYPHVARLRSSPFQHYLRQGWKEDLDPSPFFWTGWYLRIYPDVQAAGVNPLLHYLSHGANEGRDPSPLFETSWYLEKNPDVAASGINPLKHFLTRGVLEGRAPTRLHATELLANSLSADSPDAAARVFASAEADKSVRRVAVRGHVESVWSVAHRHGKLPNYIADSKWTVRTVPSFEDERPFDVDPYVTELSDVTVLPGSATIITADGKILNDEIALTRVRFPTFQPKSHHVMFLRDGTTIVRHGLGVTPKIQNGILLSKEHELNYFHWLIELLPRLFVLEKLGVPPQIPLLISDDVGETLKEALMLVKHPDRPVLYLQRDLPYAVGRLLYMSDLTRILDVDEEAADARHTYLPVGLLAEVAEEVLRRCAMPRSSRGRRLYLLRRASRRSLLNQQALMTVLIARGYEPVAIEDLDFHGQVGLMAQADVVVGPTGAAFANLLWCSPGTKVVVFYPNHPNNNKTFWLQLAAARKLDLRFIEGPRAFEVQGRYSLHDNYSIAPKDLVRTLGEDEASVHRR